MTRRMPCLVGLAILATVQFNPSRAEAQLGFVLITHGQDIMHLGDVPAKVQQEMLADLRVSGTVKVGYLYEGFGLFWLDIWTWDGQFCVYTGTNYDPIDATKAAALLGKPGKLSKPFFYRFPPGLLIVVPLVVAWAWVKMHRRRAAAAAVDQQLEAPEQDEATAYNRE